MIQDFKYWVDRPLSDKQRDWDYGEKNWVKDYVESVDHPHRDFVLSNLVDFEPWDSLLEIGCCSGPNLIRIKGAYPYSILSGIDVSWDAIEEAKKHLDPSHVDLRMGNVLKLPYVDKLFDIVLADAVLMYISPAMIEQAMNEIDRVTKKAVIIVDRFAHEDSNNGHIWARNYTKLLEQRGFTVKEQVITREMWPTSESWVKQGKIFIGTK